MQPDPRPDDAPEGVVIRQRIRDAYLQPCDRLGRKLARDTHPLLRLILDYDKWKREFTTQVPDGFWGIDLNADGYTTAFVACPCGETPQIEVGDVGGCPGCERVYWYPFAALFVANSPKGRPEPTAPAAE